MFHNKTLAANQIFSKIKPFSLNFFILFLLSFFSLVFLVSCQSTSPKPKNAQQLTNIKYLVENSCFKEQNAGFFSNVFAPGTPSVSWEGQWTQDYADLKTQLLDPSGQVIQLESLTELVDKFGAIGMRRLMCGETAFSSKIILDGHKIAVKNRVSILEYTEQTIHFEGVSEFHYGLFGLKKSPNILYWRGWIKQEAAKPESIRFGTEKDFLRLDFIDYN